MNKTECRALLIGMTSTLAGVGLARFAFTALLPGLILNQWFNEQQALLLGASNLAGYLAGALSASWLATRLGRIRVMRAAFVGILLSFALCATPLMPQPLLGWITPFHWFLGWRFVAGLAGALLMVLGPSLALSLIAPERRAFAGALVFTGIGLGALIAGTLVPTLLRFDPGLNWLLLAVLMLLISLAFFLLAPRSVEPPATRPAGNPVRPTLPLAVWLVLAAYTLDAIGFIPHTLFWVDYLAREAGLGQARASLHWVAFGLGAACGPFLAGLLVRQLGSCRALLLAYASKTLLVLLPLLSNHEMLLLLSSLLVGALVPGVVALTSGRLAELVGSQQYPLCWGRATAAFAITQALAAYGMTRFYQAVGHYQLMFGLAALALLLATLLLLIRPTSPNPMEEKP